MTRNRLLWALVVLVGIGAASGLLALRSSSQASVQPAADSAAANWSARERPAPAFTLRDQNGEAISLASYRGRPVLVTFIDPLCRNYCPLEATQLMTAARQTHTPIISVSVNPYGNARATLLADNAKWHLTREWRWAVGTDAQLSKVWKAYYVAVLITTKQIAGATVHDVTHTEGAYLLDKSGDERALFVWPYRASAVVAALKSIS